MGTIIIDNNTINYKLTRKKIKNVIFRITLGGEVLISAPYNVKISYIHDIILNKSDWLTENMKKVKQATLNSFESTDFQKIKYLGVEYLVEINEDPLIKSTMLKVEEKKLLIKLNPQINSKASNKELLKVEVISWYKERAKEIFLDRTSFYCHSLGVDFNMIRIKNQKTIWGSCSWKNNINYNLKLILAPLNIIDYIVVHEVCHLKHRNHSKAFWNQVNGLMPDYCEKKQWLKNNGHTLIL